MEQRLPLYHLFLVLRHEGFSLGTEQYLLLLKALHHKKYLLDLGIIRRTCQTLWANSQEEAWIFNRHFDLMVYSEKEVIKELEVAEEKEAKKKEQLAKDKSDEKQKSHLEKDTDEKTASTKEQEASEESSDKLAAQTTPEVSNTAPLPGQFIPFQTKNIDPFLLSGSVSPITLRQMQQSWRYLRKWKREGARTQIDLEKTFAETAQKGFFTEPAKSPPRINIVELLLLVDRNGSMLPFHGLLDELIHTALHGGRFHKARCLYFHDYPIKYLYRQPQLIEEISLTQLQQELNPKRSVVMVVSDGGAARRTYSEKRVKRTKKLQAFLKENTAAYVWLNPMPQARWLGCSAEDINDFFPMFEINQEGLYQAIDVLRGKKFVNQKNKP